MKELPQTNPIVLRLKHGHPGYRDHQIVATRDNMKSFLEGVLGRLETAGDKPGKIKSVECTLAHERADHIYVSFHTASPAEIRKDHSRAPAVRLRKALKAIYHLAAFVLAVYGLFRLFAG
jgi:hypothetical protein